MKGSSKLLLIINHHSSTSSLYVSRFRLLICLYAKGNLTFFDSKNRLEITIIFISDKDSKAQSFSHFNKILQSNKIGFHLRFVSVLVKILPVSSVSTKKYIQNSTESVHVTLTRTFKWFSKEIFDAHARLEVPLQMRSLRKCFSAHNASKVLFTAALVSFSMIKFEVNS